MRMRTLQLVCFSAITVWHAASDPRCQVKGFYQSTPFVFSCDGSGGDQDSNKVKVEVLGVTAGYQEIIRIPKGTLDFALSVDGDSPVDIEVLDAKESENVVPQKLKDVGDKEYLGSYKNMDIRYLAYSSERPTREKVSFSGSATPELSVRLKSHESGPKDLTLGFYYFPYNGMGSQCQQGGAPVGCEPFDPGPTRAATVDWAKYLRSQYSDADTAWAALMSTLSTGHAAPLTSLPFHRWCEVWNSWPGSANNADVKCEAAYKFATGGGLEANIESLLKQQFLWVWELPKVASFDGNCCGQLRSSYVDEDEAWKTVKQTQQQHNLATPVEGLSKICKDMSGSASGANPARDLIDDYRAYLDADGDHPIGEITPHDLRHCWHQPAQSTYTPPSSPTGPSTSTTCMAFTCPAPLTLRYQPEDVQCGTSGCSDSTCCLQPPTQPSPAPTGPSSLSTCTEFTCPTPLTLRVQPENVQCGSSGCSENTCCSQPPSSGDYSPSPSPTPTPTPTPVTPAPPPPRSPEEAELTPAPTPPPPPPIPGPSLKVPTVFHYNETDNKRCSGHAFTHDPSHVGCNGWSGLTAQGCKEKCATSEKAPHCPRLPCMAAVYYVQHSWCHLFSADQCLGYIDEEFANTYKKVAGGGPPRPIAPPEANPVPAPDQSTAVAHPPSLPTSPLQPHVLHKKQIPFLAAGATAGAVGGAALMAGIGVLVNGLQAPAASKEGTKVNSVFAAFKHGANQNKGTSTVGIIPQAEADTLLTWPVMKGATTLQVKSAAGFFPGRKILIDAGKPSEEENKIALHHRRRRKPTWGRQLAPGSLILEHPLEHGHLPGADVRMPGVPSTPPPFAARLSMTTSTTTMAVGGSSHSFGSLGSNGRGGSPMLPLVGLFVVCVSGLICLIVSAVLNPCNKPQRKKVAVDGVGGSVASVGSVASTDRESTYYDSYSDGYGNSVAMAGGSVYTGGSTGGSVGERYQYDYLTQEPQTYTHGFPTS